MTAPEIRNVVGELEYLSPGKIPESHSQGDSLRVTVVTLDNVLLTEIGVEEAGSGIGEGLPESK